MFAASVRPDLRQRIQAGESVFGCFRTLASPLTAEIAGASGYDWVLIDLEHGSGTESEALGQIQDLSAALGIFGQFDHPYYLQALEAVATACRKHGKCAGIPLNNPGELRARVEMGYRFLGCGGDAGFISTGMRQTVAALRAALMDEDPP